LGLKIIVLAVISIAILGKHFGTLQWIGIGLSLLAAYLVGSSGSRLNLSAWGFVAATCLFYSVSDLCMKELINKFSYLGLFPASVVSACLCYALAGVAGLALLPFVRTKSTARWKAAFPFAVFWFLGILFLFGCFASIGVVFGNIVQSTRGIVSLAMGWAVARRGHEHIEEKISGRVFGVRAAAGGLMLAAIALFYLG
jgi:drug/metabolite transporter (DMT)-like permease